jgi:hypothetical protein
MKDTGTARITCFIRYVVEPAQLDELETYARTWIELIEKYGGVHHGYFLPARSNDVLPQPSFSFPGLGTDGPPNVAVALFTFESKEAYDAYRRDVAHDPECQAAAARFKETPCFVSYERTFLVPTFARLRP